MLGHSPEEVVGKIDFWRGLIHPDDRESALDAFDKTLEGKLASLEIEYRLQSKQGKWKWILARGKVVERDGNANPLRMAGTHLDINNRKLAQSELKKSEERFRAVFLGAQDCIFIKDERLRYTHVNPAMRELVGLKDKDIVGRSSDDIFGLGTGRHMAEIENRVLQGESVEEEHTRLINGRRITFNDMYAPLRDHKGKIVGICGISRDITDRKKSGPDDVVIEHKYVSKAMKDTMREAGFAASTDSIVLLQGESGSGKDYLARWIHDHSRRANGSYFSINCAAVSKELAESELFGHEPGAFTGAQGSKRGLLELAEGGTLLLNEIGELPLSLQSKLLTFLDTKTFMRVGGEKSVRVNARLIAATHRDLEAEVKEGLFLSALYYRINVFAIRVPPLRERAEDIPIIVSALTRKLVKEMQLNEEPELDDRSLEALCKYPWPGNVRELRNVLERSIMLSESKTLKIALTPAGMDRQQWSHTIGFPGEGSLKATLDEATSALCQEALRRSKGSKKKAAKILGISRDSLYRHMKRLGIEI
jgi:PAS domain S-box-containing protein